MQQMTPIIYVPDAELRTTIVAELSAQGFAETKQVADADACVEALVLDNSSMLVVDMGIGSEKVNQILSASKTHFKIETRPILVFIDELNETALATASEYNVSQMHAGDPAPETVRACIMQLVKEFRSTSLVRGLLLKVATARSRGDWAVVTPLLEVEYAKNTSDERLAMELAENYIHERNWKAAEKILDPWLHTNPPMIRALNLKARCLMFEGKFQEAADVMGRAKLLNPHNIDRLIEFGHVLISADRVEEARQQFEEASVLDADNTEAREGVGQCMLMQGEVNEALDFLKAISGPRELASVFNSAAVMSIHNGHFKKGMTLYKKAFEVVGKDEKIASRLLFNMGLGYKKNDDLPKAIACFDKSSKLDPEFSKAAQHKQALEKASLQQSPNLYSSTHEEVGLGRSGGQPDDLFAEEDFAPFRPASGD